MRLTDARLSGGCPLEPRVTLAVVGAQCVDAVPICTGVGGTLIHICLEKAMGSSQCEAFTSAMTM